MPFQIQTQKQDQWCWAAVSASIHQYFSGEAAFSQCEIAHRVLNTACCDNPTTCNTPAFLEDALDKIGKRGDVLPGSLPFGKIMEQIDRGMPIGVRIGWFGGGGHFVVIRGYRNPAGAELLSIADPWFVDSIQYLDIFKSRYLGRGEWTDTFLINGA